MVDLPLLSIVTPVFNASRFIERTASSVFSQSYQNWEWILVDDQSTDGTVSLLKNISQRDKRVRVVVSQEKLYSFGARNVGLDKVTGRYITFLDADDIILPDRFQKQISFMMAKGIRFSHTDYGFINENDYKSSYIFRVNERVTYNDLLRRTEISCLTAMYNREGLEHLRFRPLRRKQDYAFWLDILSEVEFSHGLQELTAYYRQHNSNSTKKKSELILSHYTFLRSVTEKSVLECLTFTFLWIIRGLFVYKIMLGLGGYSDKK